MKIYEILRKNKNPHTGSLYSEVEHMKVCRQKIINVGFNNLMTLSHEESGKQIFERNLETVEVS